MDLSFTIKNIIDKLAKGLPLAQNWFAFKGKHQILHKMVAAIDKRQQKLNFQFLKFNRILYCYALPCNKSGISPE